jgi:hypothetical protein
MRLIPIRHGESDNALRYVIVGKTSCRGWTERGFTQARKLATRIAVTS